MTKRPPGAVFEQTAVRFEVTPAAVSKALDVVGPELAATIGNALMSIASLAFDSPHPPGPAPFPPAVAYMDGKTGPCARGYHEACPKERLPAVECRCSCHNLKAVP